MKAENVVKPPQKPVANSNLISFEFCDPFRDIPYTMPIIKHPNILTIKVPAGNRGEKYCFIYSDEINLNAPPKPLPNITVKIFLTEIICLSYFLKKYS